MFQNILLPVDLVDRHAHVLDIAARMALQNGGKINLVHVIETIGDTALEDDKDFYGQIHAKAQAFLKGLGKQLDDRKASWQPEIVFGHRVAEVIRRALEMSADLIILSAPRIDPANPTVNWGSMSYKISVLSQCPILLVK